MSEVVKNRGISANALKTVAVLCMLADHIGLVFLRDLQTQQLFFRVIYYAMRAVGRVTFPIMLFMLIEGLLHTGNVLRYIGRLAVLALVSEIPFDLLFNGTMWDPSRQNVVFTLTICLTVTAAIRKIYSSDAVHGEWRIIVSGAATAAGCLTAYFLKCEYGYMAVAAAVLMYAFRKNRITEYCIGSAVFVIRNLFQLFSFLAVPLICMYNGEKGRGWKYIFYVFYPAHLLLLFIIKNLIL